MILQLGRKPERKRIAPPICLTQIFKVMIREYELHERKGFNPRLEVTIQRFPHDVKALIKYFFKDGSYSFKFPSSYVAPVVADEVRRFYELVNSPHWLAEIRPNCKYIDDKHNYDTDILPF